MSLPSTVFEALIISAGIEGRDVGFAKHTTYDHRIDKRRRY